MALNLRFFGLSDGTSEDGNEKESDGDGSFHCLRGIGGPRRLGL